MVKGPQVKSSAQKHLKLCDVSKNSAVCLSAIQNGPSCAIQSQYLPDYGRGVLGGGSAQQREGKSQALSIFMSGELGVWEAGR